MRWEEEYAIIRHLLARRQAGEFQGVWVLSGKLFVRRLPWRPLERLTRDDAAKAAAMEAKVAA